MPPGTESLPGIQEETEIDENLSVDTDVAADPLESSDAPAVEEGKGSSKNEKESIRDTVKRAYEEEKAKAVGSGADSESQQAQEEAKPAPALNQPRKNGKFVKGEPNGIADPDLYPPERLKAPEKQIFNKLPAELKKAWSRSIRELEGTTTRANQEAARREYESRSIVEAVQPYAAEWGSLGFTVPQGIASLAAAQSKLKNPATRKETFLALGRDLEIDFDEMASIAKGEAPSGQSNKTLDIDSHPRFRALQDQVSQLTSERQQQVSQERSQLADSIAAEMTAVRDEVDPSTGDYRYPELHDDEFIARSKPLVAELVRTVPHISYGEALRRAHFTLTGRYVGTSPQQNQTRIPARVNNTTPNRALSAAVSVRGRSTQATNGHLLPEQIPDGVRDTVRLAYENLRRGR